MVAPLVSRDVRIHEIRPGLWRWTTFHTEWRQDVGSVAYEGDDALVLIDPLLESDDALDDLSGGRASSRSCS